MKSVDKYRDMELTMNELTNGLPQLKKDTNVERKHVIQNGKAVAVQKRGSDVGKTQGMMTECQYNHYARLIYESP